MKVAKLRVFWDQSPSIDVLEYKVAVKNEDNGEMILEKSVSFAESEVFVDVPELTNITATVVANDGVFDSEPTSISYSVGDLTKPAPVNSIGIEVVAVMDLEDPTPSGA